MKTDPEIPGKYEKVYTLDFNSLLTFETIKGDLLLIEGVEDIAFDHDVSPCEMTVYSDGNVSDETILSVVEKHGQKAQAKKLFIS